MRYCPGSGQELLSALGVIEVCQDSKFFSDTEMSFVDDRRIVEVNDMVVRVETIINITRNSVH